MYSQDAQSYQENTCSIMFIAALFIIARIWNQPRCPSTKEEIAIKKRITVDPESLGNKEGPMNYKWISGRRKVEEITWVNWGWEGMVWSLKDQVMG